MRELVKRLDPGLGAEHAIALVFLEYAVPVAVDLVHALLRPIRRRASAPSEVSVDFRLEPEAAASAHTAAAGRWRVIGKTGRLDQAVRDIHSETVDAAVEPEAQDVAELLANPRVLPVEVGLRGVEEVKVPLARGAVGVGEATPGRTAEDGFPVVGWQLAVDARAVAEQVTPSFGASLRRGECGLEPRVLI